MRVTDGRVVRRHPIVPSSRPLLARTSDGLWTTSGDTLGRPNRLSRLDPDIGQVTVTLDLGNQRPSRLVAAGDTLCVITASGELLLIR